jgi:DNA-binding MarR family transcriptional regulator
VQKRPGVTVPDIAKEIGVDPTGLYRVVRQLEEDGLVSKSGMQLTAKG